MGKSNLRRPKKVRGSFLVKDISIRFAIVIAFLITVFLILCVIVAFTKNSFSSLQNDISADFISNLKIFNKSVTTGDFTYLRDDLNSVLEDNYCVRYVFVTDDKMQEKYSSLSQDTLFIYRIPNNPSTFKLISSSEFNPDTLKAIYIKKGGYNIYIGISQSEIINDFMDGMKEEFPIFIFVAILISIIGAFIVSRSIIKPLKKIEGTVNKIGKGDLSGRLEYSNYLEINRLVHAYNLMANALQRLYSSLEAQVNTRTKELKNAYTELQSTQAMMVHSEKMKSLGELVAGIMHEINNPINFIYGNMTHLSNYSEDLINIIEAYSKNDDKLPEDVKGQLVGLKQEIDYEFLKSDMPDLIKSCKEGADRAKNIIQDLKSFSRMEEAAITDVDIVREIDTTLNILHNKIKHKAEVHKEYIDYVPKIEALGGQLNQVFMNILDNAVGAIEKTGDIWIRINTDETFTKLIIEIEDNGAGMDLETLDRVFDPFFTTKPVGQGTGLGMSITQKIIKNHQGEIDVQSTKGVGSKFTIKLPINLNRENLSPDSSDKGAN